MSACPEVGRARSFPRIVLVTDPAYGDDRIVRCVTEAARALPPGFLCVQLRDKRRALASLRVFASQLRLVTRRVGAALVVNGEPAVARDVGADGVHIGGGARTLEEARAICGARSWISVATHSDDDVRAAVEQGADAVLVSPIFATRSPAIGAEPKRGRGVDALRTARSIARSCSMTRRPALVYALGGVTASTTRACLDAGADGIAVLRELLGSVEPARVARTLHDAVAGRC